MQHSKFNMIVCFLCLAGVRTSGLFIFIYKLHDCWPVNLYLLKTCFEQIYRQMKIFLWCILHTKVFCLTAVKVLKIIDHSDSATKTKSFCSKELSKGLIQRHFKPPKATITHRNCRLGLSTKRKIYLTRRLESFFPENCFGPNLRQQFQVSRFDNFSPNWGKIFADVSEMWSLPLQKSQHEWIELHQLIQLPAG